MFEKYIEEIFSKIRTKEIILEKENGTKRFSWNIENVFMRSFKSVPKKQDEIEYEENKYSDYQVFLLTSAEANFPLFDMIVIDKSINLVNFISIKIKKPGHIHRKDDLTFLLKPLTKEFDKKTMKEEEIKKARFDIQNSIIYKLQNYCRETKKLFGISLFCIFKS